jgi:hypothetical protein
VTGTCTRTATLVVIDFWNLERVIPVKRKRRWEMSDLGTWSGELDFLVARQSSLPPPPIDW